MSVNNYVELIQHVGHKIVVTNYHEQNAAVECETCHKVIVDYDNMWCLICTKDFDAEEWDLRHSDDEGGDIHAECCAQKGPCARIRR